MCWNCDGTIITILCLMMIARNVTMQYSHLEYEHVTVIFRLDSDNAFG